MNGELCRASNLTYHDPKRYMADGAPFPEEIVVEEILMRLPVKSLVRFRLVCKSWNSLFSHPDFVRSQFNRTISQNPNHDDYLILQYKDPNALSIISSTNLLKEKLHCPFIYDKDDNDRYLVGSINGLVCLACLCDLNYHFVLWNPAIHASKIISLPEHCPFMTKENRTAYLFGFGWDSMTDDYKLLAKPLVSSNLVSVYSCKTNCWRDKVVTKDFPMRGAMSWPPCVIVKGNPYWKFYNKSEILKFEVTSNKFKYLRLPSVDRTYKLVNLNDSLAGIEYSRYGRDDMDVYCFEEERSIWFKTDTINVKKYDFVVAIPMCFKYGGEIVVDEKEKLYDPESSTEIRSYDQDDKTQLFRSYSYTPSMIVVEGMKPLHPRLQKMCS